MSLHIYAYPEIVRAVKSLRMNLEYVYVMDRIFHISTGN